MTRFYDAVNEQIGHEFAASQQYVAIAVWYDAETLPQLAAHFYRQAVEERGGKRPCRWGREKELLLFPGCSSRVAARV